MHNQAAEMKLFRKALLSGESLLYSWNVGMGMDYLGLISYYLASPLNLLSVLVPDVCVLEYFALLMLLITAITGVYFANNIAVTSVTAISNGFSINTVFILFPPHKPYSKSPPSSWVHFCCKFCFYKHP